MSQKERKDMETIRIQASSLEKAIGEVFLRLSHKGSHETYHVTFRGVEFKTDHIEPFVYILDVYTV